MRLPKELALLPFAYMAATRLKGVRDYTYLAASQWGLGLLVLFMLEDTSPFESAVHYAIGYLAFIAIYELGYLVNDLWDAKRNEGARLRFSHEIGPIYMAVFVLLRIAIFAGLTVWFHTGDPMFWAVMIMALVIVFGAHNVLQSRELRYATFTQLALFRFSLPVMFWLPKEMLVPVFTVTFLHYLYFRGLAYLDSKDLLAMPGRKQTSFGFMHTLVLFPVVATLYVATGWLLYPVCWAYTLFVYGAFKLMGRTSQGAAGR